MALCSAFSAVALMMCSERRGLLSCGHYLQDFLDDLARVLARHRFPQCLLDPVDDVALRLQCFTLRVELHVGFLELGHRDPYLFLDCGETLRSCSRFDGGNLDCPLE